MHPAQCRLRASADAEVRVADGAAARRADALPCTGDSSRSREGGGARGAAASQLRHAARRC